LQSPSALCFPVVEDHLHAFWLGSHHRVCQAQGLGAGSSGDNVTSLPMHASAEWAKTDRLSTCGVGWWTVDRAPVLSAKSRNFA
jgi:hypothetical protein